MSIFKSRRARRESHLPKPPKPTEITEHRLQKMLKVNDPTTAGLMGPEPMPALTVLLHRVCGSDVAKFEEACRLINLFMDEAEDIYT